MGDWEVAVGQKIQKWKEKGRNKISEWEAINEKESHSIRIERQWINAKAVSEIYWAVNKKRATKWISEWEKSDEVNQWITKGWQS